jgi:hypothetical protein
LVRRLLRTRPNHMKTTIFEALRASHREVEELFGDVQNAIVTSQIELARALFQLVSVKLVATMRAEHAVIYPRFAKEAGLVDEVSQALLEHTGIERMIDLLRVGGLGDEEWVDAVAHLGSLVADHADCEECTLFPIASLQLSTKSLQDMAVDYLARVQQTAPIAGASITYELPLPAPPPVMIVSIKAA